MKQVYLETSALLRWLLGQSEGEVARQAVDRAEVVLVSTLTLAEAERALIRAETESGLKGADAQRLKREARKNGMRTLRESALRKLAEGVTTFEEVVRVTAN